ncbi:hypothetical protein Q8A72_11560 [Aeribacillus pallidus]|nr:hypothetical protein [Aeribacillus pallidus]
MIVKTRTTANGTEYWDTKEKRVRFVPAGKEPDFEVTENPKSMIVEPVQGPKNEDVNLDEMSKEQLLAFAKEHDIEIPGNVSKEETIRKYIEESLAADE